jgi:hypothetical protein
MVKWLTTASIFLLANQGFATNELNAQTFQQYKNSGEFLVPCFTIQCKKRFFESLHSVHARHMHMT